MLEVQAEQQRRRCCCLLFSFLFSLPVHVVSTKQQQLKKKSADFIFSSQLSRPGSKLPFFFFVEEKRDLLVICIPFPMSHKQRSFGEEKEEEEKNAGRCAALPLLSGAFFFFFFDEGLRNSVSDSCQCPSPLPPSSFLCACSSATKQRRVAVKGTFHSQRGKRKKKSAGLS